MKFFIKFLNLPKQIKHTLKSDFTSIGRLPASHTFEHIHAELKKQECTEGRIKTILQLKIEKILLQQLEQVYQEYRDLKLESSHKMIKRSQSGYAIRGLFWDMQQKNLEQFKLIDKEILTEKIDWLKARQYIGQKLFDHEHDEINDWHPAVKSL